jgi:hypothetical protein
MELGVHGMQIITVGDCGCVNYTTLLRLALILNPQEEGCCVRAHWQYTYIL